MTPEQRAIALAAWPEALALLTELRESGNEPEDPIACFFDESIWECEPLHGVNIFARKGALDFGQWVLDSFGEPAIVEGLKAPAPPGFLPMVAVVDRQYGLLLCPLDLSSQAVA